MVYWMNDDISVPRPGPLLAMTKTERVAEARSKNICRICRKPAIGGPLTLDFGGEFAHTRCVESISS